MQHGFTGNPIQQHLEYHGNEQPRMCPKNNAISTRVYDATGIQSTVTITTNSELRH